MFANGFEVCYAEGCANRATRLHLHHPVCDKHVNDPAMNRPADPFLAAAYDRLVSQGVTPSKAAEVAADSFAEDA